VDGRDAARAQAQSQSQVSASAPAQAPARVFDADVVRRVPGGITSRALAPLGPAGIVAPMSAEVSIPPDPRAVFEQRRTVIPADIDVNGHVNNLRYLEWLLAAALAHSEAVGWPLTRYQELGAAWNVRSHNIEYLRPAFDGDEVIVRTWVSEMAKVSSRRKYQVLRPDGVVLVRAESLWVFVSRKAHALGRVPPELAAAFPIVGDR